MHTTAPVSCAPATPILTVTLNPAIDCTITVPNFTAGKVNRAQTSSDKAAGKGVNVAAALALSGHKVTATGLLGSQNQDIFSKLFERLDIHDAFAPLPGQTRIGLKIVNPQTQETTDINLPGLAATPEALAAVKAHLLKAVHAAGNMPCWVALCGSLPPGTDTMLYAEWIAQLKQAGAYTLLDTSGAALANAIATGPTLIKPNRDELQELMGCALPDARAIVKAARALIDAHGIALVAVSLGAQGACLVSGLSAVQAQPIKIPIHSTTGAGDAMVAGMLHALSITQARSNAPSTLLPAILGKNTPRLNDTTDTLADILRHGTAFSLCALQQPVETSCEAFQKGIAHWLPQIKIDVI